MTNQRRLASGFINGPIRVGAGLDRFGAPLRFSNWRFDCKVSGIDVAGECCIYDTLRTGRGGPPLHVHFAQDEWFFVREGEFIFRVGTADFRLKSGDSFLAPRRIPHTFTSVSERSALLIAFIPAGRIEQLFHEVEEISRLRNPSLEDWVTISRAKDVEILGPPLSGLEPAP